MSPRYIRHITLTTGHTRHTYWHEVSEEALSVCQGLLTRILTAPEAEAVHIPGVGDYDLRGRAGGDCLVATIWSRQPSVCLATIGVALHSRCGATLWQDLHWQGETPYVTDPTRCPPEPWVAVALETGIAHHPDAAHWLGDFERCLAWAWWDRRHQS